MIKSNQNFKGDYKESLIFDGPGSLIFWYDVEKPTKLQWL